MKKIFILLAACAVVSCSKEADTPVSGASAPVRIDPTITRATEVDFETGDAVGLTITTADGLYAENTELTFADGNFVSASGLLWYDDLGLTSTLTAYYPYADVVPTQFAVAEDQRAGGYGASDLMMARKEGVTPSVAAVGMTFRHKLVKLVINVKNEYGMVVEGVSISNSIGTADVNVEALTAAAREGAAAVTIEAREVAAGTKYAAILVPQTVGLRVDVTVNDGGKSEVHTQRLTASTLQSGAQYSMNVEVLPAEVKVSLSGDIEDWEDGGQLGETTEVPFEEFDDHFVYDGESYRTVKLADGNTWMAENLRIVPAGKTPSGDPAADAGIWYPAANAEKKADPALVPALGYLYDFATAFGVKKITVENAESFEGCQGICPKGWHIPTNAELTGLVGQNANGALTDTSAPYYDAAAKGALIPTLNEAGFNWIFAGARNKASFTGTGSYLVTNYGDTYGAMTYVAGSTCYLVRKADDGSLTNAQYYSLMSTYNASNNKVSVAYGNGASGYSVRCVKDRQ